MYPSVGCVVKCRRGTKTQAREGRRSEGCEMVRRRHRGGGLSGLWRGLEVVWRQESRVVYANWGGQEENADVKTKDYSAKKTKGERAVSRARSEASAVDLFPLSLTPAFAMSLTPAKDRGVSRGAATQATYLAAGKRRHIAAERDQGEVLCAVRRTVVCTPYLTRARHVHQWLCPSPCTLMHDGWMRIVYQRECEAISSQRTSCFLAQSCSTSTRPHSTASKAPHTPSLSSACRVQPRVLPPTHTIHQAIRCIHSLLFRQKC